MSSSHHSDLLTCDDDSCVDEVVSCCSASTDESDASANQNFLRSSLPGTQTEHECHQGDESADLRPVQELRVSDRPVTCLCFGQERARKAFVLLAAGSKDGSVVIWRCYRTDMEIAMLTEEYGDDEPPPWSSIVPVHSKMFGHARMVTSISFNHAEDKLMTSCLGRSVRIWDVDSGAQLKVFEDKQKVHAAMFLPSNSYVFVTASDRMLRVVNVQTLVAEEAFLQYSPRLQVKSSCRCTPSDPNGQAVMQKLKSEAQIRALMFDDSGRFLMAGVKTGSIHVFAVSDGSSTLQFLKFIFKFRLGQVGVSCLTFALGRYGQPPCVLANTDDGWVHILEFARGPRSDLTLRRSVPLARSMFPIKSCHSPSAHGFLVSGSGDSKVYIYPFQEDSEAQTLEHHEADVVAVAVNRQNTLLASADAVGRILLWRRIDYSHRF